MVQESTNTFSEGLITDLNPLTTPATVLTDAINATLLTFNGNELVLQNDMGNTVISGAKLSDGFTPIGIKEHGGIIYIVSKNEDTGETEIGSFPSPSRVAPESVLQIEIDINLDSSGTTLYKNYQLSNIKLSSGDAFIIFLKSWQANEFLDMISSLDGTIRKYYKLKLISINEGIETDITDTLSPQYKIENGVPVIKPYWVVPISNTETLPQDISLYTNLTQRYKLRKPGKLNLKIELEDIDKFYIKGNLKYPNIVIENSEYYLNFDFYVQALSLLKPDSIEIQLEYIYLTNPIVDSPSIFEEKAITFNEFGVSEPNLKVRLGTEYEDKIVIYKIILKNKNYDISFDNFIIEDILDLSIDPLSWTNSSNADYNYNDYYVLDYETFRTT